jgi:EAL domain-containing protein (putative c-di-GMP-specific phosphodiesterase class I)
VEALELSGEAMRVSKALGRGRVTHYTDQMAQDAGRRSAVERRLRELVADGGADVHFQPVIHVSTGSVVGVEALARWQDDELGQVPPLEFIGIAENTGLMPELGLQLLRSALHGFVASGACARGLTMGVNLSTLQLRMPGFAATVVAMAQSCGVPFGHLVAEVTESVLLADGDPAVAAVHELADAGMPIALDDFGTGYSSLAYLHRLPVAVLKIDRVMTSSMGTPRGLAIARSVADMGAALGVDVVVEGVETTAEAGLVASLGVPYAQGWLYAPAMTGHDLRTYLRSHVTLGELTEDSLSDASPSDVDEADAGSDAARVAGAGVAAPPA